MPRFDEPHWMPDYRQLDVGVDTDESEKEWRNNTIGYLLDMVVDDKKAAMRTALQELNNDELAKLMKRALAEGNVEESP